MKGVNCVFTANKTIMTTLWKDVLTRVTAHLVGRGYRRVRDPRRWLWWRSAQPFLYLRLPMDAAATAPANDLLGPQSHLTFEFRCVPWMVSSLEHSYATVSVPWMFAHQILTSSSWIPSETNSFNIYWNSSEPKVQS